MDLGKPNGIHFMPKKQQDSMADIDRFTKTVEASFGVQRRTPRKNTKDGMC
jgi:hypothetical protein